MEIAHIHGVKKGSARHKTMPLEERDGFANLMLMCTPHHSEIDNKKDGELRYPAELLRRWKASHEAGGVGRALEALGPLDLDKLGDVLAAAFVPPVDRLNAIADRLERTGTDNQRAVRELRQIANGLADLPPGADPTAASRLQYAAEVFESISLKTTAKDLKESADVFGNRLFTNAVNRLHLARGDR